MSKPDEMRSFLKDWPGEGRGVAELAGEYPDCVCECAASPEGSPGPVKDDETLRYFVNSRSDVDLKSKKKFRPASLKRMFSTGLSVCRVDVATQQEVGATAAKLFEIMQQQYGEYGGIVGVLDFKCATVRRLTHEDGGRLACVLETPLDPNSDGGFERPSHADMVHAREVCDDPQAVRVVVYNAIIAAGGEPYTPLAEADDGRLVDFLPPIQQTA